MLGMAAILIAATPIGKVAIDRGDESTQFLVDGESVARYHHGREIAKPYFSSLYAPGHIPVTYGSRTDSISAADRLQLVSVWIGYGDIIAEGLATTPLHKDAAGVDFWTDERGHGVIACLNVTTISSPGRAELRSANVWKTNGGRAILDEERLVELYNLEHGRLLIVTSTLKSAGLPVTFGDSNAGFLALRVSDQMRVDRGKASPSTKNRITNSKGQSGEASCWGRRADWCDYSGAVDEQSVGVAIFDDPANKPRACWQVRDNGLLAANPFGRGQKAGYHPFALHPEPLVRLTVGQQLTLRYGVYVHTGDAKSGAVADAFRKFLALLP